MSASPGSETIADVLARAIDAYGALADLGEDIEDEWTYVTELAAAWREQLDSLAAARGMDPADPVVVTAVDRAIDEIGRIGDAHRAIDWLSTFPQVVLLAVGAGR
jgi:hypothetical protein